VPENWASAAKGLKGKAHPFTALSAGPARCAELKGPVRTHDSAAARIPPTQEESDRFIGSSYFIA
jgi:hypothetical protein